VGNPSTRKKSTKIISSLNAISVAIMELYWLLSLMATAATAT